MGLQCGIVGLPNVGKSTLFSALTRTMAASANYPFCTIDPNVGVVNVPDHRLDSLASIFQSQSVLPAIVEFLDIAGLVKGASLGEGLGNQFLGHIRQTQAIAQVVRCFDDPDIIHVHGKVSPIDDLEVIAIELALKDLETVEKKLATLAKNEKGQNKEMAAQAKAMRPVLEKLQEQLKNGLYQLDSQEEEIIKDLQLLRSKKQMIVCNVDEANLNNLNNPHVLAVKEYASKRNLEVAIISAQVEKDISLLESADERAEFLKELGITQSGVDQLIQKAYSLLGLQTFFTAGPKEARAWTIKRGTPAPLAASEIHSDIQRGFIKAEVYQVKDIIQHGSEAKLKEKGLIRIEGKEYIVQDGDVIHFRFNV